ncbi:hypothetical protein ACE1TI_14030 [Alteribacillus sp. JSM 102045]|uniref:hypothetical protein n=1 Tax=Alteribacillus sp. JSM 102045 TaxID=1562101 RepID=UPI0035BED15B
MSLFNKKDPLETRGTVEINTLTYPDLEPHYAVTIKLYVGKHQGIEKDAFLTTDYEEAKIVKEKIKALHWEEE